MPKVVHFEIPVDAPERAQAFYGEVFGWRFAEWAGQPYWLATTGAAEEQGADGALIARGELHRAPVVIVGVTDLDDALRRVDKAGGTVVFGRHAVPGIGWSAYVEDTEGNLLGLFQDDDTAA